MTSNRFTATWASALTAKGIGFAAAPSAWAQYPYPGETRVVDGPVPAADPTMLTKLDYPKQGNTTWAMYATGNQSYVSLNDRVKFYRAGSDPAYQAWWSPYNGGNGVTWAPDVEWNPRAGKYFMYYSVATWGGPNTAIGLATSSSGLPGTWVDTGAPILTAHAGGDYQAIDPHLLIDGNNARLTWGSFRGGIYTAPVDSITGRVNGVATRIAHHGWQAPIEGADLLKWGDDYYLFFSHGSCCDGFNSNYSVRVGRSGSPTTSGSPTGPFFDRNGTDLRSGGGHVVLATHDWVQGPGGQNMHWDPWDNKMFMLYHYWDRRYPESRGRVFGINHMRFDSQGWPCWC